MKVSIITLLIIFIHSFSLAEEKTLDKLGLRIERNNIDYMIYHNFNEEPNFDNSRKLNHSVYFRLVESPAFIAADGTKYIKISIPGQTDNTIAEQESILDGGTVFYPRNETYVSEKDYGLTFWIKEDIPLNHTSIEYFKYSFDISSGLLTAPFKLRLATDNLENNLVDGSFNVSPYFGTKFRLSSVNPYFITPFVFTGITSFTLNSANTTSIIDPEVSDNGAGITYGLGVGFQFDQVTPGIVFGWDKAFGDNGSNFIYNDHMWISFSLSFDFFEPERTDDSQ